MVQLMEQRTGLIVKNYKAQDLFSSITDPQVSGLAAVWNLGIVEARLKGCSMFLILNNDIILSPDAIDNLAKKLLTRKYVMVTGVNQQEGCAQPEDMLLKTQNMLRMSQTITTQISLVL